MKSIKNKKKDNLMKMYEEMDEEIIIKEGKLKDV